MIAVDTSALMAIALDEPEADACMVAIEQGGGLVISAATVAEALIVSSRRGVGAQMSRLIDGLGLEVSAVTLASARRVSAAYDQWGKGVHPAGLNLGDCFAYEVARHRECPLLYICQDFARTDIRSAR